MSKGVMQRNLALLALLVATIFWGLGFILTKLAVAELGTYYFLSLRFLIAFLILAILFFKRLQKSSWGTIKISLILGFFLGATFILQTEGMRFTTASNSSMITGLYIVFIPVLVYLFFKRKASALLVVGIILSSIGLVFLTRYSLTGFNFGDFLNILCALFAALHITLTGEYTRKHPLIPLVTFQLLLVGLFCGGISFLQGTITPEISPLAWSSILITAVGATVLAFLIQAWAQRTIDPARIGMICALESPFGILFAWMLGGEILTYTAMIGAMLMFAGMIVSESGPWVRLLKNKVTQ